MKQTLAVTIACIAALTFSAAAVTLDEEAVLLQKGDGRQLNVEKTPASGQSADLQKHLRHVAEEIEASLKDAAAREDVRADAAKDVSTLASLVQKEVEKLRSDSGREGRQFVSCQRFTAAAFGSGKKSFSNLAEEEGAALGSSCEVLGEGLPCKHLARAARVVSALVPPAWLASGDAFCATAVNMLIPSDDEPACMRVMELVTLGVAEEHGATPGQSLAFPWVATHPGFPKSFGAACEAELPGVDCPAAAANLQSLSGDFLELMRRSEGGAAQKSNRTMGHYFRDACGAMGRVPSPQSSTLHEGTTHRAKLARLLQDAATLGQSMKGLPGVALDADMKRACRAHNAELREVWMSVDTSPFTGIGGSFGGGWGVTESQPPDHSATYQKMKASYFLTGCASVGLSTPTDIEGITALPAGVSHAVMHNFDKIAGWSRAIGAKVCFFACFSADWLRCGNTPGGPWSDCGYAFGFTGALPGGDVGVETCLSADVGGGNAGNHHSKGGQLGAIQASRSKSGMRRCTSSLPSLDDIKTMQNIAREGQYAAQNPVAYAGAKVFDAFGGGSRRRRGGGGGGAGKGPILVCTGCFAGQKRTSKGGVTVCEGAPNAAGKAKCKQCNEAMRSAGLGGKKDCTGKPSYNVAGAYR